MSYVLKINYAHKSNYGSFRNLSTIKYIVWHYTANDGDTDESNVKFFKTANRKASAHYFVDDDSITISVPDTYVAYSVGGSRYSNYKVTGGASLYKKATNSNTINIELCDTLKNGKHDVSSKTLENAIKLTKSLMKKYNIPISNVIRHFDVTGKSCPAYYVDNNKWNQVKYKLSSNSTHTSTSTSTSNIYKVKLLDDLNIRKTPNGTIVKKNGAKKGTVYTIIDTSGSWGKLKSGAGWISVSNKYVKRI